MKIKLFTTFLVLLITFNLNAQAPAWQWAKSGAGASQDMSAGVEADANGNVYITGWYNSPSITFGSTTLTNKGKADAFLTKYDPFGNVLWARSFGGDSSDFTYGIHIDPGGNAMITGGFCSPTMSLGSTVLTHTVSLTNPPIINASSDMFIAKYDVSGNLVWARSAGGSYDDFATGISTDAAGNAVITGNFTSPDLTLGNITLTNPQQLSKVFVAKYSSSGNVLWAGSSGGSSMFSATQNVSMDAGGNAFITGSYFGPTLVFGSSTLTNVNNSSNTPDIYMAKLDASGSFLWAKSIGGAGFEFPGGICNDANGNTFLTGSFQSPTLSVGNTTLTRVAGFDYFIAKYDASGNAAWAKSAGGNFDDFVNGVSVDPSGNAYIIGNFEDSISIGSTVLANDHQGNLFIAGYSSSGNVVWAEEGGGASASFGGIKVDVSGNVIVTGCFNSSISCGSTTLNNTNGQGLTNDVFVGKLNGLPTGIPEEAVPESLKIFPNPFSTQVFLQTGNALNNATLSLEDCLGQTVKQVNNIYGNTVMLARNGLPPGLYFIHLEQNGKVIATGKVLISD